MRLLTDRAPQLETPLHYFRQDFTPNDAFFVRWHLEGIPTAVDDSFRLTIGGHVEKPLSLSLSDLKSNFPATTIAAVAQCSGNARGMFSPNVPGGQWQNGAMGNARWTGVPLWELLGQVGVKDGAVDVTFGGLDRPPMSSVPDFVKSLPFEKARTPDVLVAYAMNGRDLPMLNGYPLRLVVPGWYATYWVKALDEIRVLDRAFDGFWMKSAYRIPNNPTGNEEPGHNAKDTIPISRMAVRSIFVRPAPGESVRAGSPVVLEGLAMGGEDPIVGVEVSTDGGATWRSASLGVSHGRYSWRRWTLEWMPSVGDHALMVRATSSTGETQPTKHWNHSGYQRCVVERLDVAVRA